MTKHLRVTKSLQWPTGLCTIWPPVKSLTLSATMLLLSRLPQCPWTYQSRFCLTTFLLPVPFAWNTFPTDINMSRSQRPNLITLLKIVISLPPILSSFLFYFFPQTLLPPYILYILFIYLVTSQKKKKGGWEFPGSPVVKTRCFHCQGPGSIAGRGTKIPQATQHGQKEKKKSDSIKYTTIFILK